MYRDLEELIVEFKLFSIMHQYFGFVNSENYCNMGIAEYDEHFNQHSDL